MLTTCATAWAWGPPTTIHAPWTIRDRSGASSRKVHGRPLSRVEVERKVDHDRSVGEGELEDLFVGRDGRDLRDPRRDAVPDDLHPGPDLQALTLATKQRQLELPSVAYEAVVNEEPFHLTNEFTGGTGARTAPGARPLRT